MLYVINIIVCYSNCISHTPEWQETVAAVPERYTKQTELCHPRLKRFIIVQHNALSNYRNVIVRDSNCVSHTPEWQLVESCCCTRAVYQTD